VLRDHLLDRGTALTAAARAAPDSVTFSGFLSEDVGLMGRAAVAPSPAAVEQGFWRAVQALDTVAAYEVYLDDYPEGPHAEDARERIDRLKAAPERRAAQEEQALELSREARREVQRNLSLLGFDPRGIDGIFGPGTRSALTAWQRANGFAETGYLTGNQLLRLRDQARARAEELEEEARQRRQQEERQDRAYWRETGRGSDEAGLRAYLERYPDGQFADLARQRLAEIEDSKLSEAERAERDAWQAAREMDTIAGYRDFLDAYPDSTFAEAARSRLDELRQKARDSEAARRARAEEDRFVNNRIARLLVEKRLEQLRFDPGTVDGAFDAEARRAIRRYQRSRGLPVTGYVSQDTMVRLMAGR
jgi:peptidoglycan hydrolase-like protein with peptidoglycan-binding domain